jgi:hypothetical protein
VSGDEKKSCSQLTNNLKQFSTTPDTTPKPQNYLKNIYKLNRDFVVGILSYNFKRQKYLIVNSS